jgi:hypothetical protein
MFSFGDALRKEPGIIQLILGELSIDDFLSAREVSKVWAQVSKHCAVQWLHMLVEGGRREIHDGSMHKDHVRCFVGFPNCKIVSHYYRDTMRPVLLKTIPLYEQVFTQGARRQLDRVEGYHRINRRALNRATQKYNAAQAIFDVSNREVGSAKEDYEELLDRRKRRKRLEISHPVF